MPGALSLIALDTWQTLDGEGTATLHFTESAADGGMESVFQSAPLGAVLEIALGYGDRTQTVFRGPVRAHRLQLASAGAPVMVLEAQSSSAPAVLDDSAAVTAQYGATLLALDMARELEGATTAKEATVRLHGEATLTGTTDVQAGRRLALRGVGAAFDGDLRIGAVRHRLSSEGWTTQVDVRADETTA